MGSTFSLFYFVLIRETYEQGILNVGEVCGLSFIFKFIRDLTAAES